MSNTYSFYSTILIYGFTEHEEKVLNECVNNMIMQDKIKKVNTAIKVYATDEITDIYRVPYFIAIINFKNMSIEEIDSIFEFFNECEEPLPMEFMNEFSADDFANPEIFVLNYKEYTNVKVPHVLSL